MLQNARYEFDQSTILYRVGMHIHCQELMILKHYNLP
jgi:hypothetical protein